MNTQSLLALVEELDEAAGERPDYNNIEVFIHEWKKLSAAIRGMVMEREAVDGVRRAARALRDEFRMVDDPQSDDGTVSAWRVTQLMDAVDSLTSSAAKGDGK